MIGAENVFPPKPQLGMIDVCFFFYMHSTILLLARSLLDKPGVEGFLGFIDRQDALHPVMAQSA
jgi:hypothetical protein